MHETGSLETTLEERARSRAIPAIKHSDRSTESGRGATVASWPNVDLRTR